MYEIKETLINSVKQGHVAHAQLFFGSEGSAALPLALAYGTYINCEDKQERDACGKCFNCVQINNLVHPDLHLFFPMTTLEKVSKEDLKSVLLKQWRILIKKNPYSDLSNWGTFIGAENKQFSISVDESRSMGQILSLKAFQAEYKIIVIWLPEFMNGAAANTILKSLEEPPVKTVFLLVTQNHEKILSTILSRCQLVKIRSFTNEEVQEYLEKKDTHPGSPLNKIARLADGNLNKAIQMDNDVENLYQDMFTKWMRLCFGKKFAELLTFGEDINKKGREYQKEFLMYGIKILRDVMLNQLSLSELIMQDDNERKFIENFSKTISLESIEKMYFEFSEAHTHIEGNANSKILFFDVSIKLIAAFNR